MNDTGPPEAPRPDGRRRASGSLRTLPFLITVTGILMNPITNPALPDLLDDLGRSGGAAGWFVAAGSLPGVVVAPLIGFAADRYGRRRLLVPCLLLFGVAGGLSGLAPSFELLLVGRFLQGAGAAGLINLAVVVIGDHWTGEERVHLVGRNAAVLTVSLAVLPAAGGLLAEIGGWRLPFAVFPLGVVTGLIVWRVLPDVDLGAPRGWRQQVREAAQTVRTPVVSGAIASGGVMFVLIFGLALAVLPVHLEDEYGLSAGVRGLVLAVPAVTSTLVAFNLLRLRRRLGDGVLILTGSLAFAAGFLAIGVAPGLVVVIVGLLLYGLGEGAGLPTLQHTVVESAPTAGRGAVMAVFVGVARLGQTAGPVAAGAALDPFGARALFVAGCGLASATAARQMPWIRRHLRAVGNELGAAPGDPHGAPNTPDPAPRRG